MSNIMACKQEIVKCGFKVSNIGGDLEYISDKINLPKLEEKGMVQYFYHSPSSELPVRDILNEQKRGYKTEPHIEIGAENYCIDCYQRNIKSFVKRHEKYLFLLTACRNKKLNYHYGKQFIVGYIEKAEVIDRGRFLCIKGPTKIISFDDSIGVKDLFGKNFAQSENRGKTLSLSRDVFVDNQKTEEILKHFENRTNILIECIEEINKLDAKNVLDFNQLSQKEIERYHQLYPNNAHLKRSYETENLVIVVGDKIRRTYHAVSSIMEELLGISGSIQRSIPPRVITKEHNFENLQHILGMQ
ncbi:MAG: hypothetical protein ABIH80_00065 [Methanobacteriota archaeon]